MICGIILPTTFGGHPLLVPQGGKETRVTVALLDIAMLANEFGLGLSQHTAIAFSPDRLYHGQCLDLVFCDGQMLRMDASFRDERRERFEARRFDLEPGDPSLAKNPQS
ncbi:uncharacterized protein PV07_12824 [Cladophialophora immunda]|uniref:Uncharacterized protein n=1 Tax=Cladophialophora immunda TaxID=569365 RepID=A0A0D2BTJ5_9EURO|nr:uncharacterized protein PV07_12824 [Cladophialophora immunda]KIW21745.1 hypothetical protein PV07_12824 [Cladophialophora immunda]